jgi:hypothetical protein
VFTRLVWKSYENYLYVTDPLLLVGINTRTALKDTSLPVGGGPTGMSPVGIPAGTAISKPFSTFDLFYRN